MVSEQWVGVVTGILIKLAETGKESILHDA